MPVSERIVSREEILPAATNAHTNDGGGTAVAFAYDYTGRRVRKVSSLGNNFRYVSENYALKYYALGKRDVTNTHIYAGKERVVTLVDGVPYYVHRDHLNSGGMVTTNAGMIADRVAFSAHGKVLYQQNTNSVAGLEEKFTGKNLDPETGLYYFECRYYDPELGIFTSPDTMVPDGYQSQDFNRYMYCRGNPVIYTDPTGHYVQYMIGAFFGGLASVINGDPPEMVIMSMITGGLMAGQFTSLVGRAATQRIVGGATASFVNSMVHQQARTGEVDYADAALDAGIGAVVAGMLPGVSSRGNVAAAPGDVAGRGQGRSVVQVTENGVALPPGVRIPDKLIANPSGRAGSYGRIDPSSGKFVETLRIDAATPPGMKGPNFSHFHLNGGRNHWTDIMKWPRN